MRCAASGNIINGSGKKRSVISRRSFSWIFFLEEIGPYVYNLALADAHALMSERIEELFGLEKVPPKL